MFQRNPLVILAIVVATALLVSMTGCGGGGGYKLPDPWALTEVATGAPQYVATTGFVSIQNSGEVTVYDPTGSPVTYPVAGDYVLANNGGVTSPTSDGFDYYAPGSSTPDHVVYPDANYGAPFAVDSQNRVYGIFQGTGSTITLWVYDQPTFAAIPSTFTGSLTQGFIDASDTLTLELASIVGQRYLRYSPTNGWIDLGDVAANRNTIDNNGLICGSENVGGDISTPASVFNGQTLALYNVTHNYKRGSAVGKVGTRVFGNAYLGSTVLPVVWEGSGVTSLGARLVLGSSHLDQVVAVTSKGVIVAYTTLQGDTKTGVFSPY